MYCGPQSSYIKPPLCVLFEASCQKHDEYYLRGGNWLQRLIADLFFYVYMLDDINKYVPLLHKKIFYVGWATIYFIFVRLFGGLFFNRKFAKDEKEDKI